MPCHPRRVLTLALFSSLAMASPSSFAHMLTIPIGKLATKPQVDGAFDEWQSVPAVKIPLTYLGKPKLTKDVFLKAGVFNDEIFFYSQWDDTTKDVVHKPYLWDTTANKYVEGPQREDRFAIEFAMEGHYSANWFSGNEFKADLWNWKAARTNPIGISHDKMTIISEQAMSESYKATLPNGKIMYIYRPSDLGGDPYETKRYFKKQNDVMLKYLPLATLPVGVDDVHAKGVWKDNKWYLEQNRKLNTQHSDDILFKPNSEVLGSIAVFDHEDSEHHYTSDTLKFRLKF